MKSIWIIISTLAIINLLGIAGFVGWLVSSDRLDQDRIDRLREVLSEPIAMEKARLAEQAAKDEAKAKEDAEAARRSGTPESAGEAIRRHRDELEAKEALVARLRQEVAQLQAQLATQRTKVDTDRAALDERTKALADREMELNSSLQSEQFKSALSTLEAQKPPAAKQVLQTLIDDQRKDQAVSYLAAMGERARTRIIAEFIKGDEKLAADLLERLRTRGVDAGPAATTASAGESGGTPPAP
jgi:flagellar basal body-associated protein FliL